MSNGRSKTPYFVRPSTAVLTRGFDPRLSVGSARPAVFRSSTYVFSSPEAAERAFSIALGRSKPAEGENIDLIYSRLSHPNAEILENQIVPLEPGASSAAVFNSGMAAISTLFLTFCPPGSQFIYTTPIYGGTQHLIHQMLEPLGLVGIAVPAGDTQAMATAIACAKNLRLVLIETPANPTLVMTNIEAAAKAAFQHAGTGKLRPLLAVDNTFMGPAFQHPLQMKADFAVYSATKFLAGHSDMLGGVIIGRDPELLDSLRGTRAILGNILQPDECWMLDSRLPTVNLRMNQQAKNAEKVVAALAKHPKVRKIYYPTLFTDAGQTEIFQAQCKSPGSIFSLQVSGGKRGAFDFLRRVKIAHNAVSLGGVETLACHPATTTHSEMSDDELRTTGVSDDLVRISIGVEDFRDLTADFLNALDGLS